MPKQVDFSQLQKTMEFKLRMEGNTQPWETIEVEYTIDANNQKERAAAIKFMATNFGTGVQEIRWNYHGTQQGHYFTPRDV